MPSAAARVAALVRIATGAVFAAMGADKLAGPFVHGGFEKDTRAMLEQSWPFWAAFLKTTVLPHASLFGGLVAAGELAIGLALLLGILTRGAAIAGSLLMLTILLGQTWVPAASWDRWVYAGLTTKFALLLLLLIAAADPGSVWGLDGRKKSRKT